MLPPYHQISKLRPTQPCISTHRMETSYHTMAGGEPRKSSISSIRTRVGTSKQLVWYNKGSTW
uniref:Uncharacterized protein n=1 Tax=Arundo donax TaxID=35708 RepID=A0A0A9QN60_ARUDO